MNFELKPLPYDEDTLEDFISPRTVGIHHQKHHGGYVKKLDAALEDNPLREQPLDQIMLQSSGGDFNLAAQVWNHDFYWQCLTPDPQTLEDGVLRELIESSFKSEDEFKTLFSEAAADEFGSGWAWLALDSGHKKLEVFSTTDAINPLTSGRTPLLTLDVWEHAYYLDYQNERGRYIDAFLDAHINWSFAEKNLQCALQSEQDT